jgi:hypothetical protein
MSNVYYCRPRINFIIHFGGPKRAIREFYCTYKSCNMKLAKFVHWQIHVETVHRCKKFSYNYHYVCINNLPRLLGLNKNCKTICRLCLKPIYVSLEVHRERCGVEGNKKIKFPKSKYFEFRKEQNRIPIAYQTYFKIATYFKKYK